MIKNVFWSLGQDHERNRTIKNPFSVSIQDSLGRCIPKLILICTVVIKISWLVRKWVGQSTCYLYLYLYNINLLRELTCEELYTWTRAYYIISRSKENLIRFVKTNWRNMFLWRDRARQEANEVKSDAKGVSKKGAFNSKMSHGGSKQIRLYCFPLILSPAKKFQVSISLRAFLCSKHFWNTLSSSIIEIVVTIVVFT